MRRWLLTPLVASLFLVSFVESWAALVHAARAAGIPYPEPWPWVVDGFIVAMALMVVEADRVHRARLAWWPRVGLVAATGLSVWIQAAYAPEGGEWLAAWSPLAVLFSFECLVWLARPTWVPTPLGHPVPEPEPAPDPDPEPKPEQTRPRVTQGVPRRGRPVTLGRPTKSTLTQDQVDQVREWVAEGRHRTVSKRQMATELDLNNAGRLALGRLVNDLVSQNGHGGSGGGS